MKSMLNKLLGIFKTHDVPVADDAEEYLSPRAIANSLLHHTTLKLLADPESREPFVELVEALVRADSCRKASLLIVNNTGDGLYSLLASSSAILNEAQWPMSVDALQRFSETDLFFAIPIFHEEQLLGQLILCGPLNPLWDLEFDLFAKHLGELLQYAQHARNQRRVALYEERSVVARELHDSLAQSLSYLNIQASRLQSLLQLEDDDSTNKKHQTPDVALLNTVTQNIRHTVTDANHQLREIITTFRITLKGRSFNQALEDSVNDFAKRSTVVFDIDNRLNQNILSTDEEMQFLQIAREAFSNIVRHSHASHALVSCVQRPDQTVCLIIDDDGIRSSHAQQHVKHHGLIIMQERAHKINARFQIGDAPMGGTRVLLELSLARR
ncbi:MAG: hypothetical protein GY881_10300 [Gammaproteobacteria bacterium]|jgi:two-component system nitrate/nitrite sensor histidine kinase NarX|nr:hypothetical protein [Gammaproteobacteria bacterium]MCP4879282.1 hypothetical protein [Gammaproteobacteria bacterium]MDP6165098.1 histidine kinase [Gammaproteobacteria bacterium]